MALAKELIDTLKAIDKYDDSPSKESIMLLNILANLVYETLSDRKTKATYVRELKLKALTVTIKYGV